jgi:uncharacterized protein
MSKQYFYLFFILLILIFVAFIFNFGSSEDIKNKTVYVIINNHKFNVEIADTEIKREQGLMNREHLDENAGMLFVFPKPDIQTFWMKNTHIPLDIIWIENNQIVEMTSLEPQRGDNIPEYTPKNKANYVLELNAGLAQRYGFKIGNEVKIIK